MAEKIRIGFIGAGQIARQHLTRYATMANDVEVVAVADVYAGGPCPPGA